MNSNTLQHNPSTIRMNQCTTSRAILQSMLAEAEQSGRLELSVNHPDFEVRKRILEENGFVYDEDLESWLPGDSIHGVVPHESHVSCAMLDGTEIRIEGLTEQQAANVYQALWVAVQEGRGMREIHAQLDHLISYTCYPFHDHGDEPETIMNAKSPQAGSDEAMELARSFQHLTDDELIGRRQELDFYLARYGKLHHHGHTYFLVGKELTARGLCL